MGRRRAAGPRCPGPGPGGRGGRRRPGPAGLAGPERGAVPGWPAPSRPGDRAGADRHRRPRRGAGRPGVDGERTAHAACRPCCPAASALAAQGVLTSLRDRVQRRRGHRVAVHPHPVGRPPGAGRPDGAAARHPGRALRAGRAARRGVRDGRVGAEPRARRGAGRTACPAPPPAAAGLGGDAARPAGRRARPPRRGPGGAEPASSRATSCSRAPWRWGWRAAAATRPRWCGPWERRAGRRCCGTRSTCSACCRWASSIVGGRACSTSGRLAPYRRRRPASWPAGRSAGVGHVAALERAPGGDPRRRPGRARAARDRPGAAARDQPLRGDARPGRPLLAARAHRRRRRAGGDRGGGGPGARSGWPGTARGWPGRPPRGRRSPATARSLLQCARALAEEDDRRPAAPGRTPDPDGAPPSSGRSSASGSGRWPSWSSRGRPTARSGGRLFISAKTVEHHVVADPPAAGGQQPVGPAGPAAGRAGRGRLTGGSARRVHLSSGRAPPPGDRASVAPLQAARPADVSGRGRRRPGRRRGRPRPALLGRDPGQRAAEGELAGAVDLGRRAVHLDGVPQGGGRAVGAAAGGGEDGASARSWVEVGSRRAAGYGCRRTASPRGGRRGRTGTARPGQDRGRSAESWS